MLLYCTSNVEHTNVKRDCRGYYYAGATPNLVINSGDTVNVEMVRLSSLLPCSDHIHLCSPKSFDAWYACSSGALLADAVDWAHLVLAIWTMLYVFAVHTAWRR